MINFKRSIMAGMLASSVAMSASALDAIDDSELSEVTGQDGLSVLVDLNVEIGSVVYADTDVGGGSVALETIAINGIAGIMLDVVDQATFVTDASGILAGYGMDATEAANLFGEVAVAAGYTGQDVIQFSGPNIDISKYATAENILLDVSVGAITTGGSTNSFGSLAINNINTSGTKVWMWAK